MNRWQALTAAGIEHHRLQPVPGVRLHFVGRHSGESVADFASLNCSFDVGDGATTVAGNRARVVRALGLPNLLTIRQVHSDRIIPAEAVPQDAETLEGDALVAIQPAALGVKVADCLPVYLFGVDGGAVALAHCGWRGTAARLAEKAALALARVARCPVERIGFSLGPCICGRCYVVGDDVRAQLSALPGAAEAFSPGPGTDRHRLDLRILNRAQLANLGLAEFPGLELCSLESGDRCYSVRRDRLTGRNLAVAALERGQ
ncbi:MAG: polyphenol oxidase family protein [bacterium]